MRLFKVRVRTSYEDGHYEMWRPQSEWPHYVLISAAEWWAYSLHQWISRRWHKRLQRYDNVLYILEHPEEGSN